MKKSPESGLKYKRKIGVLGGKNQGPVLIFIAGIHGNEPSGVQALSEIFSEYHGKYDLFKGKAFALCGNIRALNIKQRYIDADLNRLWIEERIKKIKNHELIDSSALSEDKEQMELFHDVTEILNKERGPFMFFDLHTTSSASCPFVLINDTLKNRVLAEKYPLRIILGIEEYLDGPFLSYINDQGHISLGFEAGQHNDPNCKEIHKQFILQTFMLSGFMRDKTLYNELIRTRRKLPFAHDFFEIRQRYRIKEKEEFKMIEGYVNFSIIKKDQLLAKNQFGNIESLESGYLFMPLYQKKGSEGFYIIKIIPTFWLRFSSFLRRINLDSVLLALPGITRYEKGVKTLKVNVQIARYLPVELLHLLGYRRVRREGFNLLFIKRETIKYLS